MADLGDIGKKTVDYLLKALVGIAVGRTGYQLFDGRWFGQAIFGSYCHQHHVELLGHRGIDALYQEFGSASLGACFSEITLIPLILLIVGVLGTTAHVLFKPYARSVSIDPGAHKLRRWYAHSHGLLTLSFLILLLGLLVPWPNKAILAVLLTGIVIPVALYLILYSKDVTTGSFPERFTYTCLIFTLLGGLILWPQAFGRGVFAPTFPQANLYGENPDHCDGTQLYRGPFFRAYEGADNKPDIFVRLCVDTRGTKHLDFFAYNGHATLAGTRRLTDILDNIVRPVSAAEGNQAVTTTKSELEQRVIR